jgi:hypothetical protein
MKKLAKLTPFWVPLLTGFLQPLGAVDQKITLTADREILRPGDTVSFKLAGAPDTTQFTVKVDSDSKVECRDNGKTNTKPPTCKAPMLTKGLAVTGYLTFTANLPPGSGNQEPTVTLLLDGSLPNDDDRGAWESTFYVGASIDSFAANETKDYLGYNSSNTTASNNLQRASGPQLGYVVGIDFAYRLAHSEKRPRWPWHLWVFGETVHGQRSTEVDCKATQPPAVCSLEKGFDISDPASAFLGILRNSTSLEAFTGARLEFFKLNPGSQNSANLYVKSQLGFLTIQNNGGDVVDDHIKAAVGTIMTNGKFRDSYLEAGWGKSDLFHLHRGRRFKFDGYLQYEFSQGISPFIQLCVNSDFGPGSDDVRTYYGVNFDIRRLFDSLKPKSTNNGAAK